MKEIDFGIGFEDGSFISCEFDETDLIVYMNSWDEKLIKIVFFNTLQFNCRRGSFTVGIFELTDETPYLIEALTSHYVKIPEDHPFKVFGLMDIEDEFIFKVVAEKISVSKEG